MEKWELLVDELDELSLVNVPAQEGADTVAIGKSMKVSIVDFKKASQRSGRKAHHAMACPDCGDEVGPGKEDCPTCGAYVPIHKAEGDEAVVPTASDVPLAFGKRYFDNSIRQYMAERGAAMPNGGFPINDGNDLHNAIQAFGRAKNKKAAAHHISQRARALNLHSMLPKDGELAELTKSHTPTIKETVMETEIEKRAKELEASNTELKKNFEVLKGILNLPFQEQAYAMRLPDTERQSFITKSAAERAEIAKPIYVSKADGTLFYRTDDTRMVDLAKRADARDEQFAKMEETAEIAKFNDDARTILKHHKGTVEIKAKLLRVIAKGFTDETERKAAIEMLKSNDAGLGEAFKMYGATGAGNEDITSDGTAAGSWNAEVEKFAKANNLPVGDLAEAKFLETAEGDRLYTELDDQRKAMSKRPAGN